MNIIIRETQNVSNIGPNPSKPNRGSTPQRRAQSTPAAPAANSPQVGRAARAANTGARPQGSGSPNAFSLSLLRLEPYTLVITALVAVIHDAIGSMKDRLPGQAR